MPFSTGHALVVGVGTYANHPQLNVAVTEADARSVASILIDEQTCGYPADQVTFLSQEQATREAILGALRSLAAKTGPQDTVFLFLCSHGVFGTDGQWYLTTHDVRLDGERVVTDSSVGEQALINGLREIGAERVIVVFNACFSGAVSPTLAAALSIVPSLSPTASTNNAILASGKGRILISASGENQYSFFVPGEPATIFTQALVEGLQGQGVANKNGYISAYNLYEHIFETVSERVEALYQREQHPELTILKGAGSFAVALYRGATALGSFEGEAADTGFGKVREVSERRAQRAINNIFGDGAQQFNVEGDLSVGGSIVQGDNISGSQVNIQGDQTNINTGGGNVYQGDVNVSGGTFVGGGQHFNTGGAPIEIHQNFSRPAEDVDPSLAADLQEAPSRLRQNIIHYLNLGEIKGVCFDLGYDYNRLAGNSLDEKVTNLVLTCRRQHRVRELIEACRAANSYPDWNE